MAISEFLRDDIIDFLGDNGLDATVEEFGIPKEDLMDDYQINEMINYLNGSKEGGVDSSEVMDMNSPDFQVAGINPEWEGRGKDDVKLGGLGIDPALLGVVDPGKKFKAVGGMVSDFARNLANKLMASKKLKANQVKKRGSEGEVVKGASRKLKDSNLRPSIPDKTAGRYKSMTDKVKKDRAVKAGTTAAAATAIGLSGDRDADGNLIPIGKSFSGGSTFKGYPEERRAREEPRGNQFGYHKKEGQNFWTVNNDDSYWDTHVMGTGDAWSDADVKKAPAKELDWSSWFN